MKWSHPNEFWLQLYQLERAFHAEGENVHDRNENIAAELRGMSPLAQREAVAALLRLAVDVPTIYSHVLADFKRTKYRKQTLQKCVA